MYWPVLLGKGGGGALDLGELVTIQGKDDGGDKEETQGNGES